MAKARKITQKNIRKGMIVYDAERDLTIEIMAAIIIKNYQYCTWGVTTDGKQTVDYRWDEDYKDEYPSLTEVIIKKDKMEVNKS